MGLYDELVKWRWGFPSWKLRYKILGILIVVVFLTPKVLDIYQKLNKPIDNKHSASSPTIQGNNNKQLATAGNNSPITYIERQENYLSKNNNSLPAAGDVLKENITFGASCEEFVKLAPIFFHGVDKIQDKIKNLDPKKLDACFFGFKNISDGILKNIHFKLRFSDIVYAWIVWPIDPVMEISIVDLNAELNKTMLGEKSLSVSSGSIDVLVKNDMSPTYSGSIIFVKSNKSRDSNKSNSNYFGKLNIELNYLFRDINSIKPYNKKATINLGKMEYLTGKPIRQKEQKKTKTKGSDPKKGQGH